MLAEIITLLRVQMVNEFFFSVFTQNNLGASPPGQQKPGDLCDRWALRGTGMVLAFRTLQSQKALMDAHERKPRLVILTAAVAYHEINPSEFKEEFEGELGGARWNSFGGVCRESLLRLEGRAGENAAFQELPLRPVTGRALDAWRYVSTQWWHAPCAKKHKVPWKWRQQVLIQGRHRREKRWRDSETLQGKVLE